MTLDNTDYFQQCGKILRAPATGMRKHIKILSTVRWTWDRSKKISPPTQWPVRWHPLPANKCMYAWTPFRPETTKHARELVTNKKKFLKPFGGYVECTYLPLQKFCKASNSQIEPMLFENGLQMGKKLLENTCRNALVFITYHCIVNNFIKCDFSRVT